jgi:GR25 family glycosyltransferase involved in LPS biosynthesis
MSMMKVTDHYLTRGEVACALSHISLWAKCVEDDQPLVVLEHDAVMVQHYPEHSMYNSIDYLGSTEQVNRKWKVHPTPPHGTDGENYHFICRAHAYSIDPQAAKNLLSYVIKYVLTAPLDIMIRTDLFPQVQFGLLAYDEDNGTKVTTIKGRNHINEEGKPAHRPSLRNDNLTF